MMAAALISRYLYGIQPSDGLTFGMSCTIVIASALVAAYFPARRAPRIDPMAALRIE